MAKTVAIPVKVADLPAVKAAMKATVEDERHRFVTLVRATCACQRCKDDVAVLLEGD